MKLALHGINWQENRMAKKPGLLVLGFVTGLLITGQNLNAQPTAYEIMEKVDKRTIPRDMISELTMNIIKIAVV